MSAMRLPFFLDRYLEGILSRDKALCNVPKAANTLYHNGGRYFENNFLKLLIGLKPIIEGKSIICVRRDNHSINLDSKT